jgi:hypothetical protein
MKMLSIMLNDPKRLVCSAALAAVLVLLAGGANALANTVWCVPTVNLNPSCTASSTKAHIQDAVSAAAAGDVIVVGPGHYNESVAITVANLSIFGAQAGKDARVNRSNPGAESIVDATGQASGPGFGAAFDIEASNVVIDGFTIQGGPQEIMPRASLLSRISLKSSTTSSRTTSWAYAYTSTVTASYNTTSLKLTISGQWGRMTPTFLGRASALRCKIFTR